MLNFTINKSSHSFIITWQISNLITTLCSKFDMTYATKKTLQMEST